MKARVDTPGTPAPVVASRIGGDGPVGGAGGTRAASDPAFRAKDGR
jgi:hypothetical protein